jgi:hypothetical protein
VPGAKQGALDALAAALPGRPGVSREQAALEAAQVEIERLRDGDRAGGGVASARGKSALGLTAGPVPPRVDAPVKAGLLALIDHVGERGWSTRRACSLLGLDPDRAAA